MAMKNMAIGNRMSAASSKPSPYAPKVSIPVRGGAGMSGSTKIMPAKVSAALAKESKGRDR